ncbi:hypothetical protein RKD28_004250 [Streptomyces sp. SAI-229]
MPRTLTAPGNAEDPVVGRRQGPVRKRPYAAVVPAVLPEPEDPADELEPEPEEDDDVVDELLDDFDDAGELLDEEPRLSLR